MSYAVKEIVKTLQGEGAQSGRAAVFCRFSGCNIWSGREQDRASSVCSFCDTDFVGMDGTGGGRFADAAALVDAVEEAWGEGAHGDRRSKRLKSSYKCEPSMPSSSCNNKKTT